MYEALLEKRHCGIKFGDVLCVFVVQDMLASLHFQCEGVGELLVAVNVVAQACKLICLA